MPRQQVAARSTFEIGQNIPTSNDAGAPTTPALQFSVKRGSDIEAHIEAYENGVTVSAQVSADGVNWTALTVPANGNVITNVVAVPGGHVNVGFRLRPGIDNYLRFFCNAGFGVIELGGSEALDVMRI